MRKEAYYFSHDSNARNDEKVLAMRMDFGMEGYGIYWCIIEKMRENTDYHCSNDFKVIAFDLRVEEVIVKKVVENYGLFMKSECGKKFYSQSLLNRMEKMIEKSEKARQSANARWNKKDKTTSKNANAMRTHNEGNAIKESKGNEIKKKENKELIIDNSAFVNSCKIKSQWRETTAMQLNVTQEVINLFVDVFENHLITMEEQKQSEKEFKTHFIHWLNKQDLSFHRKQKTGISNQRQSV